MWGCFLRLTGCAWSSLGRPRHHTKEPADSVPGGTQLNMHCFWLCFSRQQLPQHVLEDASVGIVESFLRGVDADDGLKFGRLCTFGAYGNFFARRKFLDHLANPRDLKDFVAGQFQRLSIFSRQKLKWKNTHTDQVGAMNALVTFRNHCANAQQQWSLGGPVTRRSGAVFLARQN